MNHSQFRTLLEDRVPTQNCECHCDDYAAWSDAPSGFSARLETRGQLDGDPSSKSLETVPFPGKNYWDPDYPIELDYYPQTDANVLRCPDCGAIFLAYTELSGHSPQHRIRWVRPDLLGET
jgi:hypothetical protein